MHRQDYWTPDAQAVSLFTASELLIQEHVRKYNNGAAEMKDSIRLCKLNAWMWRYCRGQSRRVTVAEAELQQKAAISNASTRAARTLKRC